jgi:hypothetical protein
MDQFVIVLIIAVIGLIKWAIEKSAEKRAQRETAERLDKIERSETPAPPLRAPRPMEQAAPDMDAAARRLREALGLPVDEELLRPEPQRPPVLPPQPPPRHFQPPPRIERKLEDLAADLERRMMAPAAAEVAPKHQPAPAKERSKPLPDAPSARGTLDELLRSRDGLRKAILVQEILGTPKGLSGA